MSEPHVATAFKRFLYYAPAATDTPDLAALGLDDVLGGAALDRRQVEGGPDGQRGVVFALAEPPGRTAAPVGYYPAAQTWTPCDDGAWWLGVYTDRAPGPDDLARPRLLDGHRVTLADGRPWLIPRARAASLVQGQPVVVPALPQRVYFHRPGITPVDDYLAFEATAEQLWREHFDASVTPDCARWPSDAAAALGLNYRVGTWEIDALSLLTTTNLHEIIEAVLDLKTLCEMLEAASPEKKSAASSSSPADATPPAICPASPPPSPGSSSSPHTATT